MNIVSQLFNSLSSYHPYAPHATVATGVFSLLFAIRKYADGASCKYRTNMAGKVLLIITGSNTGNFITELLYLQIYILKALARKPRVF